ncbi:MAG: methylated-DNA--[protein]-cysteine S-methyltransferase [Phenylobacterium sp.]
MTASPKHLIEGERNTAVGRVLVIVDETGAVRGLDFTAVAPRLSRLMDRMYPGLVRQSGDIPPAVGSALDAYFEGRLEALSQVTHRTRGTGFQTRVWRALCEIPPGETLSYGEIARRIGTPGASRAVGLANANNPVALIIPCHRVIGQSGALTGYAGGMDRKAWLLSHEGAAFRPAPEAARQSSAVISQ